MKSSPFYCIIFTFISAICSFGQELPPILKFSPTTYDAGNQNWMISQDANQFMYFANNEGLLEFNGAQWTLHPSPNETILRSVKVIDDLIYTGCYMDFGFWRRQKNGALIYESLTTSIKHKIIDDEQFWNILQFDKWVIFQSLNQIFIYDKNVKNFQVIKSKGLITKAFVVEQSVYYQTLSEGLFEIDNGKSNLVAKTPFFTKNKIIEIFKKDKELYFVTQFNGVFKSEILNLETPTLVFSLSDSKLNVYCATRIKNDALVLGTVSNGVFILSENGNVEHHFNQNKNLDNNTALSLHEDAYHNLWVGLDNGINCINLDSPIKNFSDESGMLGTVYTSIKFEDKLYIGTNQGLFVKIFKDEKAQFQLVENTNGQVWSLFSYDNQLFCGHDTGTFLIENNKSIKIYQDSGTWKFNTLEDYPDYIFQGNYFGISVLKRKDNIWSFEKKIEGFDISTRYFEWISNNEIIVSHEYKGVYKLETDTNYNIVKNVEKFKNPSKGKNAGLVKFDAAVYYASKEGIWKYNKIQKEFEKDSFLSSHFKDDDYITGKMIADDNNNLWTFTKKNITFFTPEKLSKSLKRMMIPIPTILNNAMSGYENCNQIEDNFYIIGTTNGYYTLMTNNFANSKYQINFNTIEYSEQNGEKTLADMNTEGYFKYKQNNIFIRFSVPEFHKYLITEYQYYLEGFSSDWSAWQEEPELNFKNLTSGKYKLSIRAKVGNINTENTLVYEFEIDKPWYFTHVALLIYFIVFLIVAFSINTSYKKYYSRQEEKLIEENKRMLEIIELEKEQELMRLKNEQLSQEFDSKNRELATSTMTLIKKNELLAQIKDELKKQTETEPNKNVKSVINTINKNINEEDTWNVFKDAFNNVDKDFLKKIKKEHASLTPNDLRLCAYLRLNLSSKEIAPLLNISVRSVEIKRYRLRKKMELEHEQGLVEYILAI
jgi:DNA-binding CsgD family transcriptional regulator/ligand-binding sensor domain-containing protein